MFQRISRVWVGVLVAFVAAVAVGVFVVATGGSVDCGPLYEKVRNGESPAFSTLPDQCALEGL